MKITKLAIIAFVAAPVAFFVACGGDDTVGPGPQNKPDASQPDTSPTNQSDSGQEAGNDSGKPDPCANGIPFDNKAISSWPNVPAP